MSTADVLETVALMVFVMTDDVVAVRPQLLDANIRAKVAVAIQMATDDGHNEESEV